MQIELKVVFSYFFYCIVIDLKISKILPNHFQKVNCYFHFDFEFSKWIGGILSTSK